MTHSKLVDAMASLDNGDAGPLLGIAMRARIAAGNGDFCECNEPELTGADLMCEACLRNNRDQERRAVRRLVEHHDFVPGKVAGFFCKICVGPQEWPRHHGVDGVGRTSWGEEVRPPYVGIPNSVGTSGYEQAGS